ncbi:unnamed protein product [Spirodela intermedia]|uniref:Uncharacterized protein n=1 Tax=Spirodela intermedia TaxID=51605 RepID=A0A7I8LCF9_SPIIN|nr:unnamed protein product [Spirodela intermedia]
MIDFFFMTSNNQINNLEKHRYLEY